MTKPGEIQKLEDLVVIGVSGKLGSGKDEFYLAARDFLPNVEIARYAFADALKREAWEALLKPEGMPISFFYDRNHKEKFRLLLQWWGTEWRRGHFGEDYWRKKLREAILKDLEEKFKGRAVGSVVVLITDPRFPDEADEIRQELGGFLVRVNRPVKQPSWKVLLIRLVGLVYRPKAKEHISECGLDDYKFDHTIVNDGTLQDYHKKSVQVLQQIMAQKVLKGLGGTQ